MIRTTMPNFTAKRPLLRGMTAIERAMGRFMRSPDGHDAAPAGDAPADPAPDGDALAASDSADDDASPLGGKPDADAAPGDEGGEGDDDAADKGGDEADGDTDAPPRPGAPEKYELNVPEALSAKGVQFDAEAFGAVEPMFRELGLSNDEAQKFVDTYGEKVLPIFQQRAEAATLDRATALRKEWSDAFDADETIGGANRDATLSAAARAFDHYGLKKGEGLRQLLDESGLGFHPEMIRFVARVGHDLAEGSFERGDTPSAPKSPEQKLYGDEFQPKK